MSTPSGIQELKEAEKKATKIVQAQRQEKVEKMKQAKSEAASTVEEYRATKEEEFQKVSRELASGEQADGLEATTDSEIAQMKADFKKNKGAVVNMLMGFVTDI